MTIITNNELETIHEGEKLGRSLEPGDVVALYGGLGVGKTAFTRGVANGLGITMNVSSPTFTIVNEYYGRLPLFHFDFFRLGEADDLYGIGWDDYLARGGVCAVEWSERAGEISGGIAVRMNECDEGRVIRIYDRCGYFSDRQLLENGILRDCTR